MSDHLTKPVFALEAMDVSPEAAAAARDRDAHLGTLVIGVFIGAAISLISLTIGAVVFA